MEATLKAISKRLIHLNNIKFDKDGEWTPALQAEYDRLIAERNQLMGPRIRHFVLA